MRTVCPRCGKDDTSFFSDTVFETNGIYCENCKKDFGVITKNEKRKNLTSFLYIKKEDGVEKEITFDSRWKKIHVSIKKDDDFLLKEEYPLELQDFISLSDIILYKCYLLDFPTEENVEDYNIYILSTVDNDQYSFKYRDITPIYCRVLDEIFYPFFNRKGKDENI